MNLEWGGRSFRKLPVSSICFLPPLYERCPIGRRTWTVWQGLYIYACRLGCEDVGGQAHSCTSWVYPTLKRMDNGIMERAKRISSFKIYGNSRKFEVVMDNRSVSCSSWPAQLAHIRHPPQRFLKDYAHILKHSPLHMTADQCRGDRQVAAQSRGCSNSRWRVSQVYLPSIVLRSL